MSYESDLGMEYCGGLMAKNDKPYTVVGTTVAGTVKVVWIGAESAHQAHVAVQKRLGDPIDLIAVFSGYVARADVAEAKKARP
jgi:hypothetical protein